MSRQKINIFVAGGTSLSVERSVIKSVGNDLNRIYQGKVNISVLSFENFGQNQDQYNDFIENDAHLAVFILNGTIGQETNKEFILAAKRLKKNGKPKIMVFLKDYEEETADIKYIQGLMNATTQEYWIPYGSIEELSLNAERRIRKFIDNQEYKPDVIRDKSKDLKKLLIASCIIVSLAVLSCAGLWIYKNVTEIHKESESILLFSGGGSAANYIEKYHPDFNLKHYKNGYYVNMPSASAWLMLTDEVIIRQDPNNRRFYPICLSAEAATDASFITTSKEAFLKVGSVVSVMLGYDTLTSYLKKTDELTSMLGSYEKGIITTAELSNLVSHSEKMNINVFTTSIGSGTRHMYEKALRPSGFDLSKKTTIQFTEFSDMTLLNKNDFPYLILGSKCYNVLELKENIQEGGTLELVVVDEDNNPVMKPIYLYFIAYCVDNSNVLEIPEQTLKMLEKLKFDMGDKVQDGKIKRTSLDHVILDFSSLPNW